MNKKILFYVFSFLILFFVGIKASAVPAYNVVEFQKGIYVVEIDTDKTDARLMPAYVNGLEFNENVYKNLQAELVVNAGFFDPKNKKTVSYVVIDGQTVLNPKNNKNLIENKNLIPYIDKILNRSEFRILEDENGRQTYDITEHNAPVEEGKKLLHSIQAGPMLLPDLRLEEEFFVLIENGELKSESASCLHKYARTGIGIRDNKVFIFIATTNAPLTLKELSDIAKMWGMEKAMAFDGGGSTSIDAEGLHVISDYNNQGRKLKSFLILK